MLSHPLTIGKLRGLQQLANERGVFTMLALDHRGSLRKALNPGQPAQVPPDALVDFKLLLTRILAPLASAVLLDPEYGAAQAVGAGVLPGQVGLIVSLEASGYEGGATARRNTLIPGWSVAQIKRMGAAAAKLLLYYHPEAESARDQEDLVRAVAADCRRHDIAFLLEPMSFSLDPEGAPKGSVAFARTQPRIVYDSALHLVPMGVDVLKAEFPADLTYESDAEALSHCRRLTEALRVPWVLLSAAADYALFRRQVEIACRGGASGFLVGRAVWQEMARLRREEWEEFAAITAADRMRTLADIANAEGTPYQPFLAVPPDWIRSYAAEPELAPV